jgi:hypothetical protein
MRVLPRPAAALVAVAPSLALELVHELVDRGLHVRGALPRAQDRPLRPHGGLGDLVVRDGWVLLHLELELEPGGVVQMLVELAELLCRVVLQGIRDVDVLALHLKSHQSLLIGLH